MHKMELTREQVRANNALQKKLYEAEQKKIESEIQTLNRDVNDIVKVTAERLQDIKNIDESDDN